MWPGYHMFIRKQHWYLHGTWVNLGSAECTKISLVWNRCPKISSTRSSYVQEIGSVSCQEWRYLWHSHIKNFHVMLATYITYKRKLQHVGHIRIVLWVKWVNKCDPLSVSIANILNCMYVCTCVSLCVKCYHYTVSGVMVYDWSHCCINNKINCNNYNNISMQCYIFVVTKLTAVSNLQQGHRHLSSGITSYNMWRSTCIYHSIKPATQCMYV